MEKVYDLLKELKDLGVKINIVDDRIKLDAKTGLLTNEVLEKVKYYRGDILAFLKENSKGSDEISTVATSSSYPISDAQRRLWVLNQFEKGSAYNLPVLMELEKSIHIEHFKSAINATIERHEILRTVFKENEKGEIRQWILTREDLGFQIDYKDFRKEQQKEDKVQAYINADSNKSFDLEKGPLLRAGLLQLEDERYVFYFNMHHIISDGWSMEVLRKDVFSFYEAYKTNKQPALKKLRIQYKDYSAWQLAQIEKESFTSHRSYWLESLKGELPLVDLPTTKQRPRLKTNNGYGLSAYIDQPISSKLKEYAQANGGSLLIGLMTAWNILMYRYTGQTDIIIGTPIAGREHADLEDQIGFYVNTLALRNELHPEEDFHTYYRRVRDNTLKSYHHQMYPFDRLVEDLNLARDTSRSAVFDVMLTLQNNGEKAEGVELRKEELNQVKDQGNSTSKFDIELTIQEAGDYLSLHVVYNPDVYDGEMVEGLLRHYRQLLHALLENPGEKISQIDYLSKEEKQELIVRFNDTEVAYPHDKTIIDLFEEQVMKTPNNVAVIFEGKELTYKELNENANQLAHYLKKNYKIKADDLVGIKQERSEWMIISILGVLKAGGAYVPIDPEYPQERMDYIERDTNYKACIDENELRSFRESQKNYSKKKISSQVKPNNLAYVIYTSGSTGKPKGVMVEQSGVVNLISGQTKVFSITETEKILQFSNCFFDASVEQIFLALFNGASLVLIPRDLLLNANALETFIQEHKITHLHATPGFLETINPTNYHVLKRVIAGGDVCKKELQEKWMGITDFYNEYGPTETTVTVIEYRCPLNSVEGTGILPIGKPLSNTNAYILTENLSLTPIGVTGEIFIGGAGLARGYLNQPELTNEKFISNPFKEGERLYKTGDLGRWLVDGNIEFIGRKDDQVKIRGYRIELGEIEHMLLKNKAIKEAVVLAKENDNKEKELVAYITSNEEQKTHELRSHLKELLPAYMLPSYYVQLQEMPLSKNGKIDKKSLPDPAGLGLSSGEAYVAPRNKIEEKLVKIWEEVLQRENIGINDDFFALGGHSLRAVRLSNEYQKKLSVKIPLKDLFAHVSIASHAELIQSSKKSEFIQIKKVAHQTNYPISDAQRRLWVLSQFEDGSIAYNMPGSIYLNEDIAIDVFKRAIASTIDRHEILRTIFKTDDSGELKQWILRREDLGFTIDHKDFRKEKNKEEKVNNYITADSNKAFDLEKGPLLRASLLQLEDEAYVFYFNMHHIISDGWSMEVLRKDVFSYYEAYKANKQPALKELRIQYKDYSSWQLAQVEEEAFKADKSYWLESLRGELPLLNLPSTKQRPRIKSYNGYGLNTYIDSATTGALKKYSGKNGGSLFMGLLAAWNVLMYRYTGQTDIITGTATAGREHADLEDQIGFYINTLALRNEINPIENFDKLFSKVKQSTSTAYSHQLYSFNRLVEELTLQRDASRNPVFDILLHFNNIGDVDPVAVGLDEQSVHSISDAGKLLVKYDLELHFAEVGAYIAVKINFNEDVYEKHIIEGVTQHFKSLLAQLLHHPNESVGTIDFLSKQEKEQFLKFNDTKVDYACDKTIVDLFEEQVGRTPDRIAIRSKEKIFTYKELDELSNQFARGLIENYGVKSRDLVGIKLDKGVWAVISILSVLKTGAAYVPIDPEYPASKKQHISSESKMQLLITDTTYLFDAEGFEGAIFAVDVEFDREKYSKEKINRVKDPASLAYVIYTSGSRGNPKGVMIEHGSLTNYLLWAWSAYSNGNLTELDFGLFTSLSFDLTLTSLYLPLISGGTLRIFDFTSDLSFILKTYFQDNINCIKLTPAHISLLSGIDIKNTAIQIAIVGGDKLENAQVQTLKKLNPEIKIYNEYGPTESTVGCIVKEIISQDEDILIGKPIANTQIYILNQVQGLQPTGIVGEICIGGDGLARGYLNQEELTREKFINNPFKKDERLYRTGDTGRWLLTGDIEYIGRADDQVKIRGYRIELGEVESALNRHKGVDSCAVLVRENEQDGKSLTAYVVPHIDTAFTVRQILNTSKIEHEFEAALYEMENGMSMYSYNKSEVKMLYDEVFKHKTYNRNGIAVPANACIVDIGANVGAFSMYAMVTFENAHIYSFEPLPPIYSLLKNNTSLYKGTVKTFNVGISDREEEAVFDYYPYATVLSGRHTENYRIKDDVKKFIKNSQGSKEESVTDVEMEELLKDRLITKKYQCKLKTLSQVIKENEITKIDLLKIDAENAEMEILNGIAEDDWKKIDQIVLEVYNDDNRLEKVKHMLFSYGFSVSVNQSDELEGANFYDVYAIKQNRSRSIQLTESSDNHNWYGTNALMQSIKAGLKERLQEYMIPSNIILIEEIPLTLNGKIDRKILAGLASTSFVNKVDLVAPRNELEEQLLTIWKEVLQQENIGVMDDFFALGGHSLKAIRLSNEYQRELSVKLSLKELFEHTTIASHAELIQSSKKSEFIAIEKVAEQESYPISDAQRRLWVLSQFEGGSAAYNIPGSAYLNQEINIAYFKKAIDAVIERHEILRTVFKEDERGGIRQWVLTSEDLGFQIDYKDFRKEQHKEDKVHSYINADSYKPFDLEEGPLLRASLLQLEDERYVFYFNMHHIISDGWSMEVLRKDIITCYEAYKAGKQPALKELRIQYKDYSVWQLAQLEEESFKSHRSYWLESLKGELPLVDLPTTQQRPRLKTNNGHGLSAYIDQPTSSKLKEYVQANGGSLFMGLLSAWNILMYRYTGQTDIIIGTPTAGREHADLEDQIGFYINSLALRNELHPEEDFHTFYRTVRDNTLKSYHHQMYPFDRLVEELNLARDTSRSAVFDVMLTLQNNGEKAKGFELKKEELNQVKDQGNSTSKFDIELAVQEAGDYLSLHVVYNHDVYDREMVEGLLRHYRQLLHALLENPGEKISQIDYLSKEEKQELVVRFNDTEVAYPSDKTVVDLFEEQVSKTPEKIAVVFEEKALTYQELHEESNQFAHYLQKQYNIQPDDLVAIKQERSEWMIVSILGVLKAGGAYVPIDPEYPLDRIAYIEKDTRCKVCIDTNEIKKFKKDQKKYSTAKISSTTKSGNLAYVIYTSGSTGNPKGVMIDHKSLMNYLVCGRSIYSNGSESMDFGLFTTLSFDLTVTTLYLPLISGGKLSVFDSTSDISSVLTTYFQSDIACIKLTPAHISLLKDLELRDTAIRVAIVGGDKLEAAQVKILRKLNPEIRLYNEYGPTESTVGCIVKEISSEQEPILIGKPIFNTQIYLLNNENQLQPIGVIGEICIGGTGLAQGYLNQEELTKEKFVANPFKTKERLYKTGDLGKWLPDGTIAFMGRKDDQVKIRGYRIEVGEIEHALLKNEKIEEAVVLARKNRNGEKELIAYITSKEEQNTSELSTHLKGILPTYMLPAYYVQLEILPLTTNGKIDKKSLPDPEGMGLTSGVAHVAPSNTIEEKMVKIWEEVLQRDNIGVKDDFFALGGHSLKAVRLSNEYKFIFDKKVSLNFIISNPTIQEHAEYIAVSLNESAKNQEELVKLNTFSKTNDNLVMIPPILGESVYFSGFSKFIEDKYNCYGINYGIDHSHKSLTDISSYYAAVIDRQFSNQKTTTLYLMGFSMGAPIAFEIVKQLEKLDYHCELMLIDRIPNSKSLVKKMKEITDDSNEMWLDPHLAMAAEILPNESLKVIRNQIINNHTILNNYVTSGKINSNISCLEGFTITSSATMKLWKKHTQGKFRLEKIESVHDDIFKKEHYEKIYDFMQRKEIH